MRAIGYVRVSTEEQASKGVSLAAQEAKVRAYAELHELELVDVVSDAGFSAKSLDRPGVRRVLELARAGKVDMVIVSKLDRLTRSLTDLGAMLGELKAGRWQLASVAEHLDTSTAAGRMVIGMLGVVSQWEREAIGERTAAALAHKRAIGEAYSPVPFGFTREGDRLLADPDGQEAIRIIGQLRRDRMSWRAIAAELERRGVRTSKGGATWQAMTVRRIGLRHLAA